MSKGTVVVILLIAILSIGAWFYFGKIDTEIVDEELIIKDAVIDKIDILILESFPLQVHVVASGNFSDGCTSLHKVIQRREANTFFADVSTKREKGLVCTQALVPFEEKIILDVFGLTKGTYVVDVNGVTEIFTFDSDNFLFE
jgi:inhibitor of cysteine peptidase